MPNAQRSYSAADATVPAAPEMTTGGGGEIRVCIRIRPPPRTPPTRPPPQRAAAPYPPHRSASSSTPTPTPTQPLRAAAVVDAVPLSPSSAPTPRRRGGGAKKGMLPRLKKMGRNAISPGRSEDDASVASGMSLLSLASRDSDGSPRRGSRLGKSLKRMVSNPLRTSRRSTGCGDSAQTDGPQRRSHSFTSLVSPAASFECLGETSARAEGHAVAGAYGEARRRLGPFRVSSSSSSSSLDAAEGGSRAEIEPHPRAVAAATAPPSAAAAAGEGADGLAWEADESSGTVRRADAAGTGAAAVPLSFDAVYGPAAATSRLYDEFVRPVVVSALDGQNGLVLVYGCGGTGKTHTVVGEPNDGGEKGVIPLALLECFRRIKDAAGRRQYELKLSFLEVRGDDVRDLLVPTSGEEAAESGEPPPSPEALKMSTKRIDGGDGAVRGLPEDHLVRLVAAGQRRRRVGWHAVARLDLEGQPARGAVDAGGGAAQAPAPAPKLASSLTVVDLCSSGGAGDNSLLALENLARRLSESTSAAAANDESLSSHSTPHSSLSGWSLPPLQRTKLMRMLQPDLCGDGCRIAAICTLSSLRRDVDESAKTLEFASRLQRVGRRLRPRPPPQPKESAPTPPRSAPTRSGGEEVVESELRDLRRKAQDLHEYEWKLRRAEEAAAAHRVENAALRRQLAEARAQIWGRSLTGSGDVGGVPYRDGTLMEDPRKKSQENPPSMCETDGSGTPLRKESYCHGKDQQVVDEEEEQRKLADAIQYVDHVIHSIVTKISAPNSANSKLVPPVVSFPSFGADVPGSGDSEPGGERVVEPGVEPGVAKSDGGDPAKNLTSTDFILKAAAHTQSGASATGRGVDKDDDDDESWNPAGGTKTLMDTSSYASASFASTSVASASVVTEGSWKAAGATGDLLDSASLASSSFASAVTEGSWRAAGAMWDLLDSASLTSSSFASAATEGSWRAAGVTGDLMDSSASLASGSLSAGIGGGSMATEGSWRAAGAMGMLIDAPSLASSQLRQGSHSAAGGEDGDDNDDETCGSWMAAGGTGALLDDSRSVASSSTWDTFHSSWSQGFPNGGQRQLEPEDDSANYKSALSGIADPMDLFQSIAVRDGSDPSSLVGELRRVRGLLCSVLERKGGSMIE